MQFGSLTFREIAERAAAGCIAILPTGCTEQQGPHLPVDFDTWLAENVCQAAAERALVAHSVSALVLPAMPFGPTPEHRGYGSGYIDVPQEVHEALVRGALGSLADQGFRQIVVWRGCGQHALGDVVERFNLAHVGRSRAIQPDFPYHDIWCRVADPAIPGGHADSFATSISLHLRPESVRVDKIVDPGHEPVDWHDPNLDFVRYSTTGVIGDPTHATAELGARLWEAVVEAVALTLKDISETPLM